MKKIARASLRGMPWRVRWPARLAAPEDGKLLFGECRYMPVPTLVISQEPQGEQRLDTLIHEMLHACYPDMDEPAVATTASDIARTLWRIGYRLPVDSPVSSANSEILDKPGDVG